MNHLESVRRLCREAGCRHRIIAHERPILAAKDAEGLFDLARAAPVYVLESARTGLVAAVLSMARGRPGPPLLSVLEEALDARDLRMARTAALRAAGLEPGRVPLVGHGLPCVFDALLLEHEYIYGGTGDPLYTLEVAPEDVRRVNTVILTLE